jgi:citrate lyase beta subunit
MLYLEDADGKMIDLDSQRQAEIVVRKADAISERTP